MSIKKFLKPNLTGKFILFMSLFIIGFSTGYFCKNTIQKIAFRPIDIETAETYNNLMNFISDYSSTVNKQRQTDWNYDYSSLDNYLESVKQNREDFKKLIGVPEECLENKNDVKILSNKYLKKIDNVNLYEWKLELCQGKLISFNIVGIPDGIKNYPVVF